MLNNDYKTTFDMLINEANTLLTTVRNEERNRRDSMDGIGFTQEFLDCVWNVERLTCAIESLSTIK